MWTFGKAHENFGPHINYRSAVAHVFVRAHLRHDQSDSLLSGNPSVTQPTDFIDVGLEGLCSSENQPFEVLATRDDPVERYLVDFQGVTRKLVSVFKGSDVQIGRVRGGRVFGNSYVLRDRACAFKNQSYRNYVPQDFTDAVEQERKKAEIHNRWVPGEYLYFGGSSTFGHFMYEYFYRLKVFDEIGLLNKYPIVVSSSVPERYYGFLELAGVDREKIVVLPESYAVSFETVWVTTCPNLLDGPDPSLGSDRIYRHWGPGMKKISEKVRDAAGVTSDNGPQRVFIGRRGEKTRRLVNEDELWDQLEARQFVYYSFEGKSAAEQIRDIGSAKIIVFQIGSGSSLATFARPGCYTIEICPTSVSGGHGALIAAMTIGHQHERVLSPVIEDQQDRAFHDLDSYIDVGKVIDFVDFAISKGA